MAARSVLDDNKRLVTEFYELAINQRKPAEAVRKYIDLPYRQHNPEVVDGPDGFIQFISEMQKKHPKLKVAISKALADDDLVALHVHLTREPNDPGLAIAELFRLKDGKSSNIGTWFSRSPKKPLAVIQCFEDAPKVSTRINDATRLRHA